jgi:FG-GAP-like repeat/Abnormal spindle-like microcephaly-assoc'd, ASPM-SPD-2-Hydin
LVRRNNPYFDAFIFLLATLFCFGLSSASAQTYLFNQAVFATGVQPEALAAADFNGDGKLDLAIVNHGDDTVSILLSNGDGTFQPHVDYATGANPAWLAIADFNNDGKLDLAVVNATDATVTILLGNGDGTFAPGPEPPFLTGSSNTANPLSVAAADLNADGKIDLVVANFNENKVAVFLGNGDGSFQNPVEYDTGTQPHSVAIGDYSSDGVPDIITADDSANQVSILLGNGDGTFQSHIEYGTGAGPVQVITADFNNDGKLDAATADIKTNEVSVLIGTGDGTRVFPAQEHFSGVLAESVSVAAGDFSGDGSLDAVFSTAQANAVMVFPGDGTGKLGTEADYAVGISGGNPNPVITEDFNGDGKLDLAVVNPADNTVSILLGNGDLTFSSKKTTTSATQNPASVAVADFDGDGNLDMASADVAGSQVSVFLGNGDGTFKTETTYTTGTGLNPQYIVAGDFNGDGRPDLAVVNQGSNDVGVFINNGDGTFAAQVTYATGQGPVAAVVADLNGDGKPDLAVANATDSTITILLGNGDGTFHSVSTPSAIASPVWIAAADFNGDGKLDLVTADMLGDEVSVLLGNGDGTFQTHVEYSTGTGSTPVAVTTGDFNGDGCPDIATANFLNSSVTTSPNGASVLLNNCGSGAGTFAAHADYATGLEPLSITTGDLNGDGKLDLVIGNSSTHLNAVSVLYGIGDGTFCKLDANKVCDAQPHQEYLVGINPTGKQQGVALGDFNNDGALDLAATAESADQIVVMLNEPTIALSPSCTPPAVCATASINFGDQLINATSAAQTVTITNQGSMPLTISSVVATTSYAATNSCGTTLLIGESCSVSVTFTPTATGSVAGTLTITDNALTSPQVVTLSGTGTAPSASLSPASLTFASQTVGTTSAAQTVTLSNATGTGALDITSIAASDQYAETNTCGSSVATGAECTISVTFTPTSPGTQAGTVTITDNGSNSPQTVALSGTGSGPAASLTPSTLTFSSQPEGSTSAAQTVTLTNTGNATLSITSFATSGPYGQTNTCGTSVGASAKCTISVTFTPTASGTQTGTLTVTDSASGSPHTVALTGTGTTSPFVSLDKLSLGFSTVNVGSSSSPLTITLTNTGKTALTINAGGIALSGANSGDFSLSPASNCPISPSTLASGASCTISVTFTPTASGTRTASLTFTDNAANNPQSVTLSGVGNASPVVSLSPASLDFSSETIGSPSAVKTITLTNTGNAALTITAITASTNFSETSTCGTTVDAGKNCTISVTFTPLSANSLTGTLTISDNATNSPQTVSLSGSGQGPTVGLAPTSVVFTKGVLVNSKSDPQVVTLTNTGNAALSISSIAMTGTAAAQFTETNTCGASVDAGKSCTISVVFAPSAPDNQSATLSITDNAFGSPQSVPVSGAGAGFSVAAPTTPTTVAAGQPAIFTLTMTPVGGFNQSVTLSCSDSITASTCAISPNSLTLNAPNLATVTVTVHTTARAAVPPAPRTPSNPGPWIWLAAGTLLALAAATAKRTRRTRWALAGALVVVLAWAACGGGGSMAPPVSNGTPAGDYKVTVTSSSAGLPNTTTTLNVTVQ